MKKHLFGLAALACIAFAGSASAVPMPPARPLFATSENVVEVRYMGGGGQKYQMDRGRHRGWTQGRHLGWSKYHGGRGHRRHHR